MDINGAQKSAPFGWPTYEPIHDLLTEHMIRGASVLFPSSFFIGASLLFTNASSIMGCTNGIVF